MNKGRIALTANERSHLRMILDPAYEIPSVDSLGVKKSKTEIKREQTKIWRAKNNIILCLLNLQQGFEQCSRSRDNILKGYF